MSCLCGYISVVRIICSNQPSIVNFVCLFLTFQHLRFLTSTQIQEFSFQTRHSKKKKKKIVNTHVYMFKFNLRVQILYRACIYKLLLHSQDTSTDRQHKSLISGYLHADLCFWARKGEDIWCPPITQNHCTLRLYDS